jgi:hypothetical protein
VDPHQPAYWLSKGPEEAAGFLARTAVASRTVGGFVKRAAGFQLDPHLQQVLGNAAIGAGIGGLGGLGAGLFSRRRKNPLTAALSGAAIGGVLGGAGPEVYGRVRNWLNQPDPPPGGSPMQPLDKAQISAYEAMPNWQKTLARLGLQDVPAEAPGTTGAATAPVTPLQARMDRDPLLGTALKGVGEGLGNMGRGLYNFSSFGQQPVASAAGTLGLAAAQTYHGVGRQAYRQFMQGIDPLKSSQKYTAGTPAIAGVASQPGQPSSYEETNIPRQGLKAQKWTDAVDLVKGTEGRPPVEAVNPGTRGAEWLAGIYKQRAGPWSPLRPFREAQLGHDLRRREGMGGEHGLALTEARNKGEQRLAERPWGKSRKLLEGGKYVAPHFLLQYGLRSLEPDTS